VETPARVRDSTGIAGLDHILGGGLPAERVYLVEGTPGTGKTTLALQFLLAREEGEGPALYVTVSQTKSELDAIARSHGLDISGLEIAELFVHEDAGHQQTVVQTAEQELHRTLQRIEAIIEEAKPGRVVVDSLAELRLLSTSLLRFKRSVLGLKAWMAERAVTALLLDGIEDDERTGSVEPIVHGVIVLDARSPDYGIMQRRIKVPKMRGVAFSEGWHDMSIKTGGVVVHPRLRNARDRGEVESWTLKSGDETLDELFGGGLPGNGTTLITGGTGAGKSVLSTLFLHETARRGFRAAGFLMEEMAEDFAERAREIGLDPDEEALGGRMRLKHLDPSETTQGALFDMIMAEAEAGARLIAIDSLTGFARALTAGNEVMPQFSALLNALKRLKVATLMTLNDTPHHKSGAPSLDMSFLTDNVIRLGLFERDGRIGRSIWMGKKRYGAHSRAVRELEIGAGGVTVSQIGGDFTVTDEKKPGQLS
jgi:circadian clock protein KaiC